MLSVKRDWQLQAAKARLSALVDQAQSEGPQRITRHGHPAAVVLSEADFARLNSGEDKLPLGEFLAQLGVDFPEIERDRSDGREVDLSAFDR